MKPNVLAVALISTATALPATVHAADDVCSRLIIYAITQFCQLLPNGQNLCQPIGLAKPDPTCNSPSAEQVVQIPLGPPTLQAWPYAQFTSAPNTFVPNAFVSNAFTPSTLVPNTFAPNAFVPNTLPPPAIPNQFSDNPYLTYLYGHFPIGNSALPASPAISAMTTKVPDNEPTKTPDAPVKPPVFAAIKPEPVIEAAPIPTIPTVTQPIDTLMPEAKPDARPEIIVESKADNNPTISAETASPPTEQAVTSVGSPVIAEPSSAPVAETTVTPVAEDVSTAIAAQPEATTVQIPPMVEVKPLEQPVAQVTTADAPAVTVQTAPATLLDTAITTTPASPIEADIAKQAELAHAEAEKAGQDTLAHFEFDSAELTPLGRSMLDSWIKQASTNEPILVTGHADRLGPDPYNEKLSLLRAEAVKKYLIEKGKPAKRIEIQAKGEKFPLINCTGTPTDATITCLAPNRRAEIVFKPIIRKSARTATKPYKPKANQ